MKKILFLISLVFLGCSLKIHYENGVPGIKFNHQLTHDEQAQIVNDVVEKLKKNNEVDNNDLSFEEVQKQQEKAARAKAAKKTFNQTALNSTDTSSASKSSAPRISAPKSSGYSSSRPKSHDFNNQSHELSEQNQNHDLLSCPAQIAIQIGKAVILFLLEMLIGDVSSCPNEYLRSVTVEVNRLNSPVYYKGVYLSSGNTLQKFTPDKITQNGAGIYVKNSATATGTCGVVELGYDSSDLQTFVYFENAWSQFCAAAVCYRKGGGYLSLSTVYWTIYNKLKQIVSGQRNLIDFNVDSIYCKGFNLDNTFGKFTIDYWAKAIDVNIDWIKKDISLAQTCKFIKMNLNVRS